MTPTPGVPNWTPLDGPTSSRTPLARLREELAEVRSASRLAETSLASERAARLAAEGDREQLSERVAELEAARARAVRELKEAEARDAARLAELRVERSRLEPLREQVAELQARLDAQGDAVSGDRATRVAGERAVPRRPRPAQVVDPSWSGADRSAVADAVTRAASAAAALGAALSEAAAGLSADGFATPAGSSDGAPSGSAPTDSAPTDTAAGSRPPSAVASAPARPSNAGAAASWGRRGNPRGPAAAARGG